jgi:hypothetical protein
VTVGGLVLVRQRPGAAKGVIFMTLEEAGETIATTARADEVRRPQPWVAQKRQGNRFAQSPRLDDPRPPAVATVDGAEAKRAMPTGRNFR